MDIDNIFFESKQILFSLRHERTGASRGRGVTFLGIALVFSDLRIQSSIVVMVLQRFAIWEYALNGCST